jgi:tripartite-type tricarboxylate transporter receptor subunit TctC
MPTPAASPQRRALTLAALGGLFAAPWAARAQEPYPSRPVKIVMPSPPGSGNDTTARFVAERLSRLSGQPFVVEARPGGNGFIAAQAVKQAPADGYTIMLASSSLMAGNPALFKQLPYDPVADFVPIGRITRAPFALFVAANSPYKTLADLVAAGRANPDRLRYAYPGASTNIMMYGFLEMAKMKAQGVPYQGPPAALLDVAGGQVDFAIVAVTIAGALLQGGRLRMLATTTEARLRGHPDVPTVAETGVGDFSYYDWAALFVPAKTPAPAVERLSGWLRQIVQDSETQTFFANQSSETAWADGEAMRKFQIDEIAWWKRMAAGAGIEPQ